MRNNIYISDLDGTLLNYNKEISSNSRKIINKLIEQGCKVSVATARTPATVEFLLQEINIKDPIILMNGAVLYDLQKHSYLEIEYISQDIVERLIYQLGELLKLSFIYTIIDNKLVVHYQKLENEYKTTFYKERLGSPYKHFTIEPLSDLTKVAYFVFLDTQERIQQIYERVKDIEEIALVMYKDVYSKEGYILEVYSNKATKGNAIKKLKVRGYDQVICFGDNLNDLCMFQVADEAYAVENAVEELKQVAKAVIGNHNEDSVAKYIQSHYETMKKENDELC